MAKGRQRIYTIWQGMFKRCYNKNNSRYYHYGGRGIRINRLWHKFDFFYKWAIRNGYSDELQIDRINNDGNYTPSNCRWVTPKENNRNKRNNHWLEMFGEKRTITDWANDPRCKVSPQTFIGRVLTEKWNPEEAFNTKPKHVTKITIFGETKTLLAWSEDPRCNTSYNAFKKRINNGWNYEEAMRHPKHKKRGLNNG